jgi:hypothetical protein
MQEELLVEVEVGDEVNMDVLCAPISFRACGTRSEKIYPSHHKEQPAEGVSITCPGSESIWRAFG